MGNQLGSRNICALAVIRRSLRLLVCSSEGFLHLYSLDQTEGGDCSLIRQFPLAEEVVVPGSVGEEVEEEQVKKEEQPEISYSDTVKNGVPPGRRWRIPTSRLRSLLTQDLLKFPTFAIKLLGNIASHVFKTSN